MWPFVTILWLTKSGHNEDVKKSWKSPSLSGFLWRLKAVTMRRVLESFESLAIALFLTICDKKKLYYNNRHIVTVTNLTICDEFLTR
jgi:hypothetical protein